jgi:DNA-directed RNA polymerase specialized sigma24 family protein
MPFQSAWTIAWRRLGSLRDVAQVRSWLIAIAANEAASIAGENAARPWSTYRTPWTELAQRTPPTTSMSSISSVRFAAWAPTTRRLLALRFAGGLDSNEISQYLGLSASGVRSRLSRLIDAFAPSSTTGEGSSR